MYLKQLRLIVLLLGCASLSFAQQTDTLALTNHQAEDLFLKNNLSLLASQYGIDASKALIQQAKLWDNPVLLTDQNLYDGKLFSHSKSSTGQASGEVYVQVQQLIRTAGKISKLQNLAAANARMSELQFQVLLRNLRYAIHTDLYQVGQNLHIIHIFDQELEQITRLFSGLKVQLQAGNISQKDLLRIQALQISLLQEKAGYKNQLIDLQNELHNLLQANPKFFIKPVSGDSTYNIPPRVVELDSAINLAKQYNAEYLLEQASLSWQQNNLSYQKALRVPDVTAGIEYDKSNSYVPHYYGLTLSLPLPIWNRNQGNIASAGYAVKQEQTAVQEKALKLGSDIQAAIERLNLNQQLVQSIDPGFLGTYDLLIRNVIQAYQQRQLALPEFIDLFDNYKETQLKFLQQQYNLLKTKEDLNLLTGKDII